MDLVGKAKGWNLLDEIVLTYWWRKKICTEDAHVVVDCRTDDPCVCGRFTFEGGDA